MIFQSLDDIVESGLCTGCGICESLAGRQVVEMGMSAEQRLRPETKSPVENHKLQKIMQVCPGIAVHGPNTEKRVPFKKVNKIFGIINSSYRGWASNEKVRSHAASGGVLTALGMYLLESKKVEAILHVKASNKNPLMSKIQVSTTPQQVYSGAQSRYGPAAPLKNILNILDEGRTFAVIAKPCDIGAIKNLERIDVRVKQQIPYTLTMFCGGLPSLRLPMGMLRHFDIHVDEVKQFRWRGEGWPGPTHIETYDGRIFNLTYEQSYFSDNVSWTYDSQFRCKICPDAIGELADIVCPDGWIMENGRPIYREAPGVNIIISRTPRGDDLLQQAQSSGAVILKSFNEDELMTMHADHIPRKIGWPARFLGAKLGGASVTKVENLRKVSAIFCCGPIFFLKTMMKTYWRIIKGNNFEVSFRNQHQKKYH